MDRRTNPYSPGAGTPPYELVGREDVLEDASVLLDRVKAGRPEKSILLTGLRGVGKTVLLNEIGRLADKANYQSIFVEAHEGKRLEQILVPVLRTLLIELDQLKGAKEGVKRAFGVLRSFVDGLRVKYADIEIGYDIDPETGYADSGSLEMDLPVLFQTIAEAALDRKTAVAILIDELQYLNKAELGALIMGVHRIQQLQLPLVLVGAGLPVLLELAGESKSYAERLFNFPAIGPLSRSDAFRAIQYPALQLDVRYDESALEYIYKVTEGYPYFLQEWGYVTWNVAAISPISFMDVELATKEVLRKLDQNFFLVRFDRLTEAQKKFLRAMARLGSGPSKTGDIAAALNQKISAISTLRDQLIKKGIIYSPTHGELAFTVPLFDEFMLRAVPAV